MTPWSATPLHPATALRQAAVLLARAPFLPRPAKPPYRSSDATSPPGNATSLRCVWDVVAGVQRRCIAHQARGVVVRGQNSMSVTNPLRPAMAAVPEEGEAARRRGTLLLTMLPKRQLSQPGAGFADKTDLWIPCALKAEGIAPRRAIANGCAIGQYFPPCASVAWSGPDARGGEAPGRKQKRNRS
jgi:hypothetical protein